MGERYRPNPRAHESQALPKMEEGAGKEMLGKLQLAWPPQPCLRPVALGLPSSVWVSNPSLLWSEQGLI